MVIIKLTLINSGDTDGLVKDYGELYLNNSKDPVNIVESNTPNTMEGIVFYEKDPFQSIPKRSMVQRIFIINESKTA